MCVKKPSCLWCSIVISIVKLGQVHATDLSTENGLLETYFSTSCTKDQMIVLWVHKVTIKWLFQKGIFNHTAIKKVCCFRITHTCASFSEGTLWRPVASARISLVPDCTYFSAFLTRTFVPLWNSLLLNWLAYSIKYVSGSKWKVSF